MTQFPTQYLSLPSFVQPQVGESACFSQSQASIEMDMELMDVDGTNGHQDPTGTSRCDASCGGEHRGGGPSGGHAQAIEVNGLDQDSRETLLTALKANKDLNARLDASKSKYKALRWRVMVRLVGGMARWSREENMLRQQLASAQRAEDEMRGKLDEERRAKEDVQQDLEASRRRIDALEGDLERVTGERDTLRQQCAEMCHKLDKERESRRAMEADVNLFMQQHLKPPPSGDAPLLYAFAGNTSADKYTVRPSHSQLRRRKAR